MRKKHTLWIEKYRSSTLEKYIGNEEIKTKIQKYIDNNDIPHLLLIGPAGTGKTTLAKLLVNNIKCDYIYINASDENGIDVIREKIKGFASTATFNPIKVVILDEADFLTQPAQAALRNLTEEYSLHTRFILTGNYIERLSNPLISRCEIMKITPPTPGEVAKHLVQNIFTEEGIDKYDLKDVKTLIKKHYPDVRSIIKYAQSCTKDNEFIYKETGGEWLSKLLQLLENNPKSLWYDVRQLVANEQVDDFQETYRFMFDNLSKFSKGNDAEISIIIDEHMWRSNSVPDKEINFAACIAKLIPFIQKQIIK